MKPSSFGEKTSFINDLVYEGLTGRRDRTSVKGVLFSGLNFSGGAIIENVDFIEVTIADSRLEGIRFKGCYFKGLEDYNTDAGLIKGCGLKEVVFEKCKFNNFKIIKRSNTFQNITFSDYLFTSSATPGDPVFLSGYTANYFPNQQSRHSSVWSLYSAWLY